MSLKGQWEKSLLSPILSLLIAIRLLYVCNPSPPEWLDRFGWFFSYLYLDQGEWEVKNLGLQILLCRVKNFKMDKQRDIQLIKERLHEFWKIDMFWETFTLIACAISKSIFRHGNMAIFEVSKNVWQFFMFKHMCLANLILLIMINNGI